MSSNRPPIQAPAVVHYGDRPVGPLVMPMAEPESFVAEFNRTYRSIGLTVTINEHGHPLVSQLKGLHSERANGGGEPSVNNPDWPIDRVNNE